ncbi:MAG: hypothetical protein ABIK65_05405 [Candidatus Eisenbacteria bacterium]
MEDLNFRQLDERIASIQQRFLRLEEERSRFEDDRSRYEEKVRALQGELSSLRESGERLTLLETENEQYRKSQEQVRRQVGRMLERIRSIES